MQMRLHAQALPEWRIIEVKKMEMRVVYSVRVIRNHKNGIEQRKTREVISSRHQYKTELESKT